MTRNGIQMKRDEDERTYNTERNKSQLDRNNMSIFIVLKSLQDQEIVQLLIGAYSYSYFY